MANYTDEHIGEKLRQRCQEIGVTEAQLAEVLDVPVARVLNYQSGAIRISASHLILISRALNVSIGYFYDEFEGRFCEEARPPRLRLISR